MGYNIGNKVKSIDALVQQENVFVERHGHIRLVHESWFKKWRLSTTESYIQKGYVYFALLQEERSLTPQELYIEDFLVHFLGVKKGLDAFDYLKKMYMMLDDDYDKNEGLIMSLGEVGNIPLRSKVTQRILYIARTLRNTTGYSRVFGEKKRVTAKQFVVLSYRKYREIYYKNERPEDKR